MQDQYYVSVALPVPLHQYFDYQWPNEIAIKYAQRGCRVKVPFANRHLIGIIVELKSEPSIDGPIKTIGQLIDKTPILSQQLLALLQWAAQYYHHPLGDVINSALPTHLRAGKSVHARIVFWQLNTLNPAQPAKSAHRQQDAIDLLTRNKKLSQNALQQHGISLQTLKTLAAKNWIQSTTSTDSSSSTPIKNALQLSLQSPLAEPPLPLNQEQSDIIAEISPNLNQFKTFLIQGVTGSGKTELYLQLSERVIKSGYQVLILVPEIGLTPQTLTRFRQRFHPYLVGHYHSGLSDRDRFENWRQVHDQALPILVGTRSAIFAPFSKLGLVIVDEEHDGSFKQQDGFRYSARDLAVRRGQMENATIVLGSATPSFESLQNGYLNRYRLLYLRHRAGNAIPPKFHLIDIRSQKLQEGLSTPLLKKMHAHLSAGHQVLLFINRRGFAPTLICHRCGWIAECDHCDVKLTLHSHPFFLQCHHCNQKKPVLLSCPQCQAPKLFALGLGTERAELFLSRYFEQYPIIRIDSDSVKNKTAFKRIFTTVLEGEPSILVGTQMVSKGHHFPNLTLVAILDSDGGFFSPDFRGMERMGQIITQVAGRAGREDQPGEVAIQTHFPDHPIMQLLISKGYEDFAKSTLITRQEAAMPPFGYLALIRAESPKSEAAELFLSELKQLLLSLDQQIAEDVANKPATKPTDMTVEILGPVPAPIQRKAGKYQAQLLLQSQNRVLLQQRLTQLMANPAAIKALIQHSIRWSIDVDPIDLY